MQAARLRLFDGWVSVASRTGGVELLVRLEEQPPAELVAADQPVEDAAAGKGWLIASLFGVASGAGGGGMWSGSLAAKSQPEPQPEPESEDAALESGTAKKSWLGLWGGDRSPSVAAAASDTAEPEPELALEPEQEPEVDMAVTEPKGVAGWLGSSLWGGTPAAVEAAKTVAQEAETEAEPEAEAAEKVEGAEAAAAKPSWLSGALWGGDSPAKVAARAEATEKAEAKAAAKAEAKAEAAAAAAEAKVVQAEARAEADAAAADAKLKAKARVVAAAAEAKAMAKAGSGVAADGLTGSLALRPRATVASAKPAVYRSLRKTVVREGPEMASGRVGTLKADCEFTAMETGPCLAGRGGAPCLRNQSK